MCCQAEDYLTALQFLYNGFIRALAAKDLMRCLRLVIVRRIGGSRGGGRGPLATPYFYPPTPSPLRVWIRYCIVLVVNMNKFYHRLFFSMLHDMIICWRRTRPTFSANEL